MRSLTEILNENIFDNVASISPEIIELMKLGFETLDDERKTLYKKLNSDISIKVTSHEYFEKEDNYSEEYNITKPEAYIVLDSSHKDYDYNMAMLIVKGQKDNGENIAFAWYNDFRDNYINVTAGCTQFVAGPDLKKMTPKTVNINWYYKGMWENICINSATIPEFETIKYDPKFNKFLTDIRKIKFE